MKHYPKGFSSCYTEERIPSKVTRKIDDKEYVFLSVESNYKKYDIMINCEGTYVTTLLDVPKDKVLSTIKNYTK